LWTPERVLILDPPRGVTAISALTGEIAWEFRPPRGRLQAQWSKLSDSLVLQTLEPSEFWMIDPVTGRGRQSVPGKHAPWSQPAVDWNQGRFGFVTISREIWAWSAHEPDRWRYRGGVSFAHADPWIVQDGGHAAVLIDGTTLVGLDIASGTRRWSVGLADFPIIDPPAQTATAEGVVAAVWPGKIRAASLHDGAIVWESSLPMSDAWTVSAWCGQFAASSGHSPQLLLFDASTGHTRQALRHPHGGLRGRWHLDEDGVLFASPQTLAAWKPLASR
jgi:outer membrane protein assembly factor BamB